MTALRRLKDHGVSVEGKKISISIESKTNAANASPMRLRYLMRRGFIKAALNRPQAMAANIRAAEAEAVNPEMSVKPVIRNRISSMTSRSRNAAAMRI